MIKKVDFEIRTPSVFNIDNFDKRVSISDNLFKDIPSIKDSGKIYDLKKGSFIYNLPRQSENKKNVSNSTKYKTLSLFDYIKPILMPEIDVDLYSELHFPSPLFNYQIQGIKFLLSNKSALLADQMGTGKTVMTTTAIRILFIKGLIKKAMVVVPSNLINVWQSHLKNWAPELQFLTINDTKDMRNILWQIRAHVYIISYDTLKNDYKEKSVLLKDFSKNLDLIVLDEAHNIKNKDTFKAKAVKSISKNAHYRWALSGTPLQNNIKELVSLLEFLIPNQKFDNLTIEELKEILKSIMLRRLKKDVLSQLPEKLPPEIEKFELSPIQKQYYENYLNYERSRLLNLYERIKYEKNFNYMMKQNLIFSLQKLRQICNFPPESIHSPKVERLKEIVKELADQKEKVVIFTNFVNEGVDKIIKNLKTILQPQQIVSYHGSLKPEEKNLAVKKFVEDEKCLVFVGTINAAGEGLTLTSSSYVIFFDLHWNPAKMWQAEDRVHRIGQKNKVNIYTFITQNTVEEKILQKLEEKRSMINNVIDDVSSDIESVSLSDLLDFIGLSPSVI